MLMEYLVGLKGWHAIAAGLLLFLFGLFASKIAMGVLVSWLAGTLIGRGAAELTVAKRSGCDE